MKLTKLKDIVVVLGDIKYSTWGILTNIVELLTENKAHVIDKQWYDNYKNNNLQYYTLDLYNINTWSTFESCIDFKFSITGNSVRCDAKIYDGDSLYGNRQGVRFDAVIELPLSFLRKLEPNLMYELKEYYADEYDKLLNSRRDKWIIDKIEKLIK